jgi:hypothetical protein
MEPSLKRMRELGVGGANEAPLPVRIDTAVRDVDSLGRQ